MNARQRGVMRKRLGLSGWAGSKPFNNYSMTLVSKTYGEGHNPGTTTGTTFTLPVNNWNDPLGNLSTLVAGTGLLSEKRHPIHHDDALLHLYNTVQVLSWKAEIDINHIKESEALNAIGDYYVAYTFSQNASTQVALDPATNLARIERFNIFSNPMWTVIRRDAGIHRKYRPIVISVPSVFEYMKITAAGANSAENFGNPVISHTIADVAFDSGPPTNTLFCRIVIGKESGTAMAIDTLHVTIAITQKVRIMRNFTGTKDIIFGVTDSHA